MADHLPLPPGRRLESRRRSGPPGSGRAIDRSSKASKLRSDLSQIGDGPNEELDETDAEAFLVLKLDASNRLDSGPLNGLNLVQLGESQGWTYAVLSNSTARILLTQLIDEYAATTAEDMGDWQHPKTWAALLDNIEGISVYSREDRASPELLEEFLDYPIVVDVLVWPSTTASISAQRLSEVQGIIQQRSELGGFPEVLATDPRPQTTSMRVRVDQTTLNSLLDNSWVERVRLPLRSEFTQRRILNAADPKNLPMPTIGPIGVLDTLVAESNPLLAGRVVKSRGFPQHHVFSSGGDHGTAVASVACWGNLDFIVLNQSAPPSAAIVAARVLDPNHAREILEIPGQDHTTIEAAIRWLVSDMGCRVVTMSINRPEAETTLLRSEMSAALDSLIRELKFVLVVSSGNRFQEPSTGWLDGYPSYIHDEAARVTDPGDAALALTVGCVAHRAVPSGPPAEQRVVVAREGDPSPFSRTGPVKGRNSLGMNKPELSHAAGNVVYDHKAENFHFDDPGVSVVVATEPIGGQYITTEVGSSFSAPAVAYEVARIAERYPEASANMLRALVALSGRRSEATPLLNANEIQASLYGVPSADRVLESSGRIAILTVEDEIDCGTVVVHELPVPYEFARGGSSREFRVALAFDPPTLRSRREYIGGWMTVELVRGLSFEEVRQRYEVQPSIAQAEADPSVSRLELPSGRLRPALNPGPTQTSSNTVIRRDYIDKSWDPDDETYFLVVSHNQSPWTPKQRREYGHQGYALTVQLVENDRVDLDLHALVEARLRGRIRGQARLS